MGQYAALPSLDLVDTLPAALAMLETA